MREFMKFEIRDPRWVEELQLGLEDYMDKLYQSVEAKAELADKKPATESGMPFCACNTCESRELFFYIAPRAIRAYLDGQIGFFDASESEVIEHLTKDDGPNLKD
jgi:hypothetical protein